MSAITTTSNQSITQHFNTEQLKVLKQQIAPKCSDTELDYFIEVCKQTNLSPFTREIYAISRETWNPETQRKEPKMSIQVSIDGLRKRAANSGYYDGSTTFWCGEDGKWLEVWLKSTPPSAAKTVVYRKGCGQPFTAVARFDAYKQDFKGKLSGLWEKMPDIMIGKCFSEDTEVLTDQGFQLFNATTGNILQVTDTGLQATDSIPFRQDYFGIMIESNGDMLNFSVTPNHDMVTTVGKIEASALYDSARTRAKFHIPLTIESSFVDYPIEDEKLLLCGYVLADGSHNGYNQWRIECSKPQKVEALRELSPISEGIHRTSGNIASTASRQIKTNFDKSVFRFDFKKLFTLINEKKVVNIDLILQLSKRQARLLIDAWVAFDGSTNKKTGVRRLFTSRKDHLQAVEVLAVVAGYSVNVPRIRTSDISTKPNYCITISEPKPQPVIKPIDDRPGLIVSQNKTNSVWCVTVPSGKIIVRRNGFSMVCGNCSEALALRKAFPEQTAGLYASEEMDQASNITPQAQPVNIPQPEIAAGWDEKLWGLFEKGVKRCDSLEKFEKLVDWISKQSQPNPRQDREIAQRMKSLTDELNGRSAVDIPSPDSIAKPVKSAQIETVQSFAVEDVDVQQAISLDEDLHLDALNLGSGIDF